MPKTLIYAKTDFHEEDINEVVQQEFGKHNQKYGEKKRFNMHDLSETIKEKFSTISEVETGKFANSFF